MVLATPMTVMWLVAALFTIGPLLGSADTSSHAAASPVVVFVAVGGAGLVAGWIALLSHRVEQWSLVRRLVIGVGIACGIVCSGVFAFNAVRLGSVAAGLFYALPGLLGVQQLIRLLVCRRKKSLAS